MPERTSGQDLCSSLVLAYFDPNRLIEKMTVATCASARLTSAFAIAERDIIKEIIFRAVLERPVLEWSLPRPNQFSFR